MRSMKLRYLAVFFSFLSACHFSTSGAEIRQQKFNMNSPERGEIRREAILAGENSEVETFHVAAAGPTTFSEAADDEHALIVLFLSGNGRLRFLSEHHAIVAETIAMPMSHDELTIDVAEGEVLHCLVARKAYNEQDLKDMPSYVNRRNGGLYLKKFSDCQPYTEAIKSPKTVSRTVLPNEYIPRVAMGTVQTSGPDAVAAHRHPMLDQLFLALAGNDVVVTADDTHTRLTEFTLLHIPLGSLHGVKVEEGRQLYYMWMDFFLTKEGEEWLKTHKPATE